MHISVHEEKKRYDQGDDVTLIRSRSTTNVVVSRKLDGDDIDGHDRVTQAQPHRLWISKMVMDTRTSSGVLLRLAVQLVALLDSRLRSLHSSLLNTSQDNLFPRRTRIGLPSSATHVVSEVILLVSTSVVNVIRIPIYLWTCGRLVRMNKCISSDLI